MRRDAEYGAGCGGVLQTGEALACGHPVPHRIVPRRPGDIAMMVADSSALKQRFGWVPVHDSLDEIVVSALSWEEATRFRDIAIYGTSPRR